MLICTIQGAAKQMQKTAIFRNDVIAENSMNERFKKLSFWLPRTLLVTKQQLFFVYIFSFRPYSRPLCVRRIFCPGHSGVRGNERTDSLAGQTTN